MAGPQTELVIVGWRRTAIHLISNVTPGLSFQVETGDYITNMQREFATYLGLVDRYSFLMRLVDAPQTSNVSPVLMAAERDILGVAYQATDTSRIVILPAPTKVSLDEGVEVLLAESYDIRHGQTPEPEWLSEIALPSEDALRNNFDHVVAELETTPRYE